MYITIVVCLQMSTADVEENNTSKTAEEMSKESETAATEQVFCQCCLSHCVVTEFVS